MAAQTLRNLVTGQAFINFVGAHGMVSTLLTVPRISEHPISAEAFAALRERILSQSSAATPISEALRLVAEREQKLLDARRALEREPEPETFRTRRRAGGAAGQGRSRPAAAQPRSGRLVRERAKGRSIRRHRSHGSKSGGMPIPVKGRDRRRRRHFVPPLTGAAPAEGHPCERWQGCSLDRVTIEQCHQQNRIAAASWIEAVCASGEAA